ncbi:MAG: TetR-like C-terminal domain-containing protein [Gordonia sp. (in: high G+C Gram-positive bacteria)]
MKPTRRRGADLERALHEAVLAELAEHEYAGVTFEGVAARASTSKPVLYRRWSTKSEMVLAATRQMLMDKAEQLRELGDSGSLAGDLTAPMRAFGTFVCAARRRTLLGMLADLGPNSADQLQSLLFAQTELLMTPIITRARDRGELGDTEIPLPVRRLPIDVARHDMLVGGGLTDERIDVIVNEITVPLWEFYSRR